MADSAMTIFGLARFVLSPRRKLDRTEPSLSAASPRPTGGAFLSRQPSRTFDWPIHTRNAPPRTWISPSAHGNAVSTAAAPSTVSVHHMNTPAWMPAVVAHA